MTDFIMYLLRHFCSNRVEFFYNTQETQTQKNDVAMATIYSFLYMGCTLAPPEEYD